MVTELLSTEQIALFQDVFHRYNLLKNTKKQISVT